MNTTDPESIAICAAVYRDVYTSIYYTYDKVNFKISHLLSHIIFDQVEEVVARSANIDIKPVVHSVLETYEQT